MTTNDERLKTKNKIAAVILAAGKGTRMKSDIPKVLQPLGSSTLLDKVISSLKKSDVDNITVLVGHQGDLVRKHVNRLPGINIAVQKQLLGSGDAVRSALDDVCFDEENIIVTCGDTPLIKPDTFRAMVEEHISNKAECTLLTSKVSDPYGYGRILRGTGNKVTAIVEEKDASPEQKRINEINVGTYCFKKAALEQYINEIKINENKKEFYLTDIVDIINSDGKKVVAYNADTEESIGVNTKIDLAEVNDMQNKRNLEKLMVSGVTILSPSTIIIDEDVEIGSDTVIFPNTVIESGVKIGSGCRIGPFARIRPGTVIADDVEVGNFVEINRTAIGAHTKVKHHSYLGDAVLGKGVNIGAGTITANYDGVNKNKTIIRDEAFIGVGVTLIAPVEVGERARVGAGSVVTKGKNVPADTTVVGIPARQFKG